MTHGLGTPAAALRPAPALRGRATLEHMATLLAALRTALLAGREAPAFADRGAAAPAPRP